MKGLKSNLDTGIDDLQNVNKQIDMIAKKLSPKIDKDTLDLIARYIQTLQKQNEIISELSWANENLRKGFIDC